MINDVMNDADAKMGKSVEATREEFAAIRAGRANPIEFGLSRFDLVLTDDRVERRFFGRADTILPTLESLGWPIERTT